MQLKNQHIITVLDTREIPFHTFEYDKNGNTTKEISYSNSGKEERISTYEFNDKGLLLKQHVNEILGEPYEISNIYNTDGKLSESKTIYSNNYEEVSSYQYEKNKIIKTVIDSDEEFISKTIIETNNANKPIAQHHQDDVSEMLIQRKFIYDSSNNLVGREVYNYGKLEEKYVYNYNEDGLEIKIEQYDNQNQLIRIYLTEYDNKKKIEHSVELPLDNYKQTTEWEYDAQGKWKIEAITDNMGRMIRQLQVERDEFGSITNLKQIEAGQGNSGVAVRKYVNEYFK